ncbi:hypothetical protein AB6C54_23405 [Vibrio splendidus]
MNKKLTQLGSFWVALLTPLLLSSGAVVMILTSTPLIFDLTHTGLEYFWKTFHIPLTIASSSLPLVGLVALNHRSEQTAKQIEVAQEQNIFTNYYKHREEFIKYVDNQLPDREVNTLHAHRVLFPNSKKSVKGTFKPSSPLDINLYSQITSICGDFHNRTSHNNILECDKEKDLVIKIKKIFDTLNMTHHRYSLGLSKGDYYDNPFEIAGFCVRLMEGITERIKLIIKLVEFEDEKYTEDYHEIISHLEWYISNVVTMDSGGDEQEYHPLDMLSSLLERLSLLESKSIKVSQE